MKILASFILFLVCLSFKISAFSASDNPARLKENSISHFIIFGDSLSDTGNFPEPASIGSPRIDNFNLYIPDSNPVSSVLYGISGTPDIKFLRNSIPEQGTINHKKRSLYSINWPLYLVYHFDPGKSLTTWVNHYQHPQQQICNINYAWAGALAGHASDKSLCFHEEGEVFQGACTEASIIYHRNLYRKKTAKNPHYDHDHRFTYSDLQIPSLTRQVSMYLGDRTLGDKNNTAIFIFIGINDLAGYIRENLVSASLFPLHFFDRIAKKKVHAIAGSVVNNVERLKASFESTANRYHVYVLTIPHLSIFHSAYHYITIPLFGNRLKRSMNSVIDIYNHELQSTFNHDRHVTVIDTGDKINQLAKTSRYYDSVIHGKDCQNDPSNSYIRPDKTVNSNCHYDDHGKDRIYFNWNNSHLSAQVNQTLANHIQKKM